MPTIYGTNTKGLGHLLAKSDAIRRLEEILSESQELLAAATAGGDRQYAFELLVDEKELLQAANIVYDLNTRIRQELSGRA